MSTADNPSLDRVRHGSSDGSPDEAAAWSRPLPHREQAVGKQVWLYAGFLGIALMLLYASVFKELWDLWMTREDYSHGFLIPLIGLYLVKTKWADLVNLPIKPAPALGFGMVLLSLAALVVGVAGGVITLSSVSFIGALIGLTFMLFGTTYGRALSLPFAYLVFMTPVLDVLVEPLHHPLQLLAANVVSGLFAAVGVPTYLDGIIIQFPNGVLEVSVQCSGAGYLISILAIGLPLAFIALHRRRSRLMLLTAALVISILANWARITLIGTVGYITGWGPQVHGPLHILQGMLVYWIGFGALFAGAWILAKVERGKMMHARRPAMVGPISETTPAWHTWRRLWWIALATLVTAIVYLYGYDRGPVAPKESFASLPRTIGQWTMVDGGQASPVVRIPGADEEMVRVYRKGDGSTTGLYLAYLSSQTQGRELVNYLTASLHRETVGAEITIGAESQPVNIGFSGDHQARRPILFWYALNGRAFADRYQAKAATIAQALMHKGSNGALVLIFGESKRDGQEVAVDDVEQFAQDLVPVLRPYLP